MMKHHMSLRRNKHCACSKSREEVAQLSMAQAHLLNFKRSCLSPPPCLLSNNPSLSLSPSMNSLNQPSNSEQQPSTHTLCSSQLSPRSDSQSTAYGPSSDANAASAKNGHDLESNPVESSYSSRQRMRRQPSKAEQQATTQLELQLPGFMR